MQNFEKNQESSKPFSKVFLTNRGLETYSLKFFRKFEKKNENFCKKKRS